MCPICAKTSFLAHHLVDNETNKTNKNSPKHHLSYLILNPGGVAGVTDLKKAAEVILISTGLDPETYRIGNTKA